MKYKCLRKNHGFTLVEILVACGIFTLFMGGAFALYRQGGKMFTGGTWRQTTQKAAEKFLSTLRDRASRCSSPIIVDSSGVISDEYTSVFNVVSSKNDEEEITLTANSDGTKVSEKLIAYFPVCVSSIRRSSKNLDEAASEGIIMYNVLKIVPSNLYSNVFDLEFRSVQDIGDTENKKADELSVFTKDISDKSMFNGDPAHYGLGSKLNILKLTDVSSVTVSTKLPFTSSEDHPAMGRNGLFKMKFHFRNPRDNNVSFDLDFAVSIDPGVNIKRFTL